MPEFTYDIPRQRIVFGPGAVRRQLRDEIESLRFTRLLAVTSPARQRISADLLCSLSDLITGTFTGVRPHVPVAVAEAARERARAAEADAILSIGGGSTVGTAKAIALTTGLPIIAVPTTYAGSEVTPVWGLTEHGHKRTGKHPAVLPRLVVYDPELLRSMPQSMAAASGFNALAHCVEAFWGPGRNGSVDVIAEEGIRALGAGLRALADGTGDAAAPDLLYGAYLAGSAFATAGSGLHHKLCHILGGTYDLPHAQTHAVVLPYVLALNAPGAPEAVHRIGRALHSADPVAALRDLAKRLRIPTSLCEIGLAAGDLDEAAALATAVVPDDNPVPADRTALRALLAAAWSGTAAPEQP
ncbi:maleylacetate reductase [Nocardia sp. CDC159]|uniref:Maleylacetate reductase n=1 Tax=Nocardia pulmonis TaxID=2951408 RepID=A0A9X2J065_9NOCA|nr:MULTISPECIES: maleylacetate reductase [Nocardia]MCM6777444.1 maleylacetate reductase [Nocardia pulmonis]MCM6790449.1 maleylacetate reductase [Nocardia sp. CDC159]